MTTVLKRAIDMLSICYYVIDMPYYAELQLCYAESARVLYLFCFGPSANLQLVCFIAYEIPDKFCSRDRRLLRKHLSMYSHLFAGVLLSLNLFGQSSSMSTQSIKTKQQIHTNSSCCCIYGNLLANCRHDF